MGRIEEARMAVLEVAGEYLNASSAYTERWTAIDKNDPLNGVARLTRD